MKCVRFQHIIDIEAVQLKARHEHKEKTARAWPNEVAEGTHWAPNFFSADTRSAPRLVCRIHILLFDIRVLYSCYLGIY